jgi:fructose-1,6-bisphosphatase/inositol monophosphatase family enzyme
MKVPVDKITAAIEGVAAREVMPRFRTLSKSDVRAKENGELVTTADLIAEKALSERLQALVPGSQVVGEEAVHADPALMERLAGDDPVWVIDPIDGTGNFARGTPVFAVMVALVVAGRTVAAWIHDPVMPRTAVGEVGAGAFMGGRRLKVRAPSSPEDMKGTLHASSFAPPGLARRVSKRRDRVQALKSVRCAGWEYLRLVTGEMDFTLFTRLMPWDHAPGILLHHEAGGVANCFDGTPYNALRHREIGVLMAPDAPSWHYLNETLLADE